ncbi:MAG: MucBP domain-containing protein [Bacteroidaceae bacterium]|nr:MucBP domain-containing protein [Bacteroidaceae bacterium]
MKKLFTLITLLSLCIGSMWGQEITTWSSDLISTLQTKDQLVASAGTGKRYAFRMPSTSVPGWCNFVTRTEYSTTGFNDISTEALFCIETGSSSGTYNLKRYSDGKYLSGNNTFGDTGMDLTLTDRAPSNVGDFTQGLGYESPYVSFDDSSGKHYNCGNSGEIDGGLQFRGGTGGWSVYVIVGPVYIVKVNYVDSNGGSVQASGTHFVLDGTTVNTAAPEISGYRLTSTSTPNTPTVTVSGADVEITYTYEEKWPVNFDKSTRSSHDARYTDKVGLGNQSYSFSAAAGDYIYHDFTNQTFEAPYNTAVTPVIGYRGHAMYGYLYIDYNNDGDFVDDGELVSQLAENSWTDAMRNDDKTIPDFTPSKGGIYRMRYKIDWENTDPGGSSSIASNGGTIIDITLKVYYTIAVNGLIPDGTEITFKENTVTNGSRVYADSPANSDINVTFPSGRDYSYSVSIAGSTITINMLPYVEITDVANLKNGLYVIQGKANGSTGFWYHDKSLSNSRYFRMSTRSSPTLLTYEDNFTSNLKYLWNMTKGESSFTLQNVGTNNFAPADAQRNKNFTGTTTGNFVWDSEHAAIYQTNNTNGGRTLYVHCNALENQDLNLSYWDNDAPTSLNAGSGSLVAPKFYKVDDRFFMNKYVTQLEAINWGSELSQYWLTGEYAYLTPSINDIISDLKKGYTPERYTQANTLLANYALNMPTEGFYRFKAAARSADDNTKNWYMGGRDLGSNDGHGNKTEIYSASTTDEHASDANTIFYLEQDEDGYHLISYFSGMHSNGTEYNELGTKSNFTLTQAIKANNTDKLLGEYKLVNTGTSKTIVMWSNETLNAIDGNNDWSGWTIEHVEELPVTFNSAALGYATFNSPVALIVPTDKVKAYVCRIDGNTIRMYYADQLKDGNNWILPANTPVLLYNSNYATKATVDLTVTSYTGEVYENNGFNKGTVAAETPDTENNIYYALRKLKSGTLGFYQRADQSAALTGFRAWIEVPKTQGARNFTIAFDGESDPTGIVEALGLEDANVEIYDLNGRKLSSYKNGINIVNGKKVFK